MTQPQLLGKLKDGLYCTDIKVVSRTRTSVVDDDSQNSQESHIKSCNVVVNNNKSEQLKLWHLRLGHMPFGQISLVRHEVAGINNVDCVCQVCPAAW